jgi:F-type H+-transporting ATPase subunit epsilon
MNYLRFQLVTPERTVLKKELVSLTCPTPLGDITILPHHIPLVSTLATGELHAKTEDEEFFIFVSGGFVQVREGNDVIVLADTAERNTEIDIARAEEARKRAEAAMKEQVMSEEEYATVAANLERSLARLRLARKHSRRQGGSGQGMFED